MRRTGTIARSAASGAWNTSGAARSIGSSRLGGVSGIQNALKTSLPALKPAGPTIPAILVARHSAPATRLLSGASVSQANGLGQDKPNVQIAKQMPRYYSEMSNEVMFL